MSPDLKCAIEYYFRAEVISGDHNKSLSITLPVKIQAPEQEGAPVKMAMQTEVQGCCYIDLGVFAMSLNVDDPTIFIFQPITGKYFIDNSQCKSNITLIHCKVTETINATGRKDGVGSPMAKSISNVLSEYTIAGIPEGQKREYPLNLSIPVTVRPPEDIASSRGAILSRSYTLEVIPDFERCICCGNIGLSCPIYISNDENVIDEMTNPSRIPLNNPPGMINPQGPMPAISPNNTIVMPSVNPQAFPQNLPSSQNSTFLQNAPLPLNAGQPLFYNLQNSNQSMNNGLQNSNNNITANTDLNKSSNQLVL